MRKSLLTTVLTSTFIFMVASLSFAQIGSTKVSGLVFGDYYYVARNHNPDLEGRNGFWTRRVYVTFDHKFEDDLSARVRFEAASPGDFESSGKIEPFVKHLYLNWKLGSDHSVYFGLSGPPTFAVVEELWGYRAVEKTPLDLYKFGPSSDFGVSVKGNLGDQFKYHGMVSNGAGTSTETDSGKKASFSLGFYPNETFLVEGYVDTESRSDNGDRQTYQVFSALRNKRGRIGFLMARQHRQEIGFEDDLDIASVFAIYHINENMTLLGRYDRMFDPNPQGEKISYLPFSPTAKSSMVLLGVDYQVSENLNLIPNVEHVSYDGVTPTPNNDLISRFTIYFTF